MICKVCGQKLEIVRGQVSSFIQHVNEDTSNCSIGAIEVYHSDPKQVEGAYNLLTEAVGEHGWH